MHDMTGPKLLLDLPVALQGVSGRVAGLSRDQGGSFKMLKIRVTWCTDVVFDEKHGIFSKMTTVTWETDD